MCEYGNSDALPPAPLTANARWNWRISTHQQVENSAIVRISPVDLAEV